MIFSDFWRFTVGGGQCGCVGPDPEDAKISKNPILVENDLKHPQTTIETHLDGFGDHWDRLGEPTWYTIFLDFLEFFW